MKINDLKPKPSPRLKKINDLLLTPDQLIHKPSDSEIKSFQFSILDYE